MHDERSAGGGVTVLVGADHRDQVVDAVLAVAEAELGEVVTDLTAERVQARLIHWREVLDQLAGSGAITLTATAADLRRVAHVLMGRGAAALAVDALTGGDDAKPVRVLRRHLACWRAGDEIREQVARWVGVSER